jgi:hypothetical protein
MSTPTASPAFLQPTPNNVRTVIERFRNDRAASLSDQTLSMIVNLYPANIDVREVLAKVALVNSLYSTHILGIVELAFHIVRCNIDDAFARGSNEAINSIMESKFNGVARQNLSFTTKYCSWHNQTAYPIYDGKVDACRFTPKRARIKYSASGRLARMRY